MKKGGSKPPAVPGSAIRRDFLAHADPFSRIFDLAEYAIISVDRRHSILLFNQGAEKMFGYSAQEVMGASLNLLLPARFAEAHGEYVRAFDRSSETSHRMADRPDVLGRRKDGAEFPAEASISKIVFEGETMLTVIMRDVTERSQAEERLKASLREKEVLLKEIHHRVKNNLQVVSSLLGLQARSIDDLNTRKKFQESQDRIQSMALLHECLYQSDSLAKIDFSDYLQRVADQLFRSHGIAARVHLVSRLEKLHFDVDAAVPCGLIVNELLSNSLKYAFPKNRKGEVRLELESAGTGWAKLVVADNGVGLPRELDWIEASSLGLRLVRTLAEQIHARVELSRSSGTEFSLIFPNAEPAAGVRTHGGAGWEADRA